MARISKIVCDKCGAEEEFKGRYATGWGLLEVVNLSGNNAKFELCPKCTKEVRNSMP